MSAAPLRVHRAQDPHVETYRLPSYYRRIADTLINDPRVPNTAFRIFCRTVSLDPSFTPDVIRLSAREVARRIKCHDITVRRAWRALEALGYVVYEQDRSTRGAPYVLRITHEIRLELKAEEAAEVFNANVYSGTRLGDKTSAEPQSASRRTKECATSGASRRTQRCASRRTQECAPTFPLLESGERETTTTVNPDPHEDRPSTTDPSSSFFPLNLPDSGTPPESEGPSEAPGSPQDDPQAQDVQTPTADAAIALARDQAVQAACRLWSDIDEDFHLRKIREGATLWHEEGKAVDADGNAVKPPWPECLEVVHLAIRYGVTQNARSWAHVLANAPGRTGTMVRWITSGWDLATIRNEVKNHEPRPKSTTPPPAVQRKAQAEPVDSEERRKAGAELLRAYRVSEPAARDAAVAKWTAVLERLDEVEGRNDKAGMQVFGKTRTPAPE